MADFNQSTPAPENPELQGFPVSSLNLQFSVALALEQDEFDESNPWKCLRTDGQLLIDSIPVQGKGSFELGSFLYSTLKRHGGFDLFNCSCGVAGCAGINENALLHPLGAKHIALILPAQDYSLSNVARAHRLESNLAKNLLANFPSLLKTGQKVFYGSLQPDSLIFVFEYQALLKLARDARRFIRLCEIEQGCHAYPFHGNLFSMPEDPFHVQLALSSRRHRDNLYWESYREEVYGEFISSYVYVKPAPTSDDGEASFDCANPSDDRDLFVSSLPDLLNSIARFQEGVETDGFAQLSDSLKVKEKSLFAQISTHGFSSFIEQLPSEIKNYLIAEFPPLIASNLFSAYISAPRFTWLTPAKQ